MRPVGDGANVPSLLVTERLHSIEVPDYGLALKASYNRITSYNVCYTKLLRLVEDQPVDLHKAVEFRLTDVLRKEDVDLALIEKGDTEDAHRYAMASTAGSISW